MDEGGRILLKETGESAETIFRKIPVVIIFFEPVEMGPFWKRLVLKENWFI